MQPDLSSSSSLTRGPTRYAPQDTTNRYAELTLRAKAEALRVCELGSGISAVPRARAAWKDDKALLTWLNSL